MKMRDSLDDKDAIKWACRTAHSLASEHTSVAFRYVALEFTDVPRSCKPALREIRRVVSSLLDQWMDAYRGCLPCSRGNLNADTWRAGSDGAEHRAAEPGTSRVCELMRSHAHTYQKAKVGQRRREDVVRRVAPTGDGPRSRHRRDGWAGVRALLRTAARRQLMRER